MPEVTITLRDQVLAKRRFREAGASENQLARFDQLSALSQIYCPALIRRGVVGSVEEALAAVEWIDRKRKR